jgi:cohesin loading factor subunit SCC2
MTSQQPTLRSRSLKSVTDLLEKDPDILTRSKTFVNNIIRCTKDKSSSVRDSALVLLGKCLNIKPTLELQVYPFFINLAGDEAVNVRKHAMKTLKEIYLRQQKDQDIQSAIAAALMLRVKDIVDDVAENARQTFEELWIAPFRNSKKDLVQEKLSMERQVALIAKTTQRGEKAIEVLDVLLQHVLSRKFKKTDTKNSDAKHTDNKNAEGNFNVCKAMVGIMFDGMIDNESQSERPSQQHMAEALTVFAKAEPKLFNSNQLKLLQPYLKNLSTTDNLPIYRSSVIIFRHVLPSLPSIEQELLQDVAGALVQSITKITKTELPDTVTCLWIITCVLKSADRIVRVMKSLLVNIDKHKAIDFSDPEKAPELKRLGRYMEIAGFFGKTCNFDEQAEEFKKAFPKWEGKTVSGLTIDLIYPYTRQKYPRALRETALESIAAVCQGWPQHYLRSDVSTAFELVFHNNDTRLEHIVLTGFLLFFQQEERRSETGADIKPGEGIEKSHERLQTSFLSSDSDAGATTIAQKFLTHILRIALASTDDIALTATEAIASISRQGLVHPKECAQVFVALETSTNQAIAKIAYEEHKSAATKHDSLFEKEYMKAVQQAFTYQQDVIHDPRGVTLAPVVPKLHPLFDILKEGKVQVRKRVIANLCSKLNFELPKLETSSEIPSIVLFTRFILENLAFFDYPRVDEIIELVSKLEKLVIQGIGTVVAHAIELDVLKVQIEESSQQQMDLSQPSQPLSDQPLDPARLRRLAIASTILLMVWETRTHLRQLWGLQKSKASVKPNPKDFNKVPTRTPFVSADKHLDKIAAIISSLSTPATQLRACKDFAELVSVDNELKVSSENDEEAELARQATGYDTPDENGNDATSNPSSTGGRGKKRKGSVGIPGTPSVKRRKAMGTPKKARGNAQGWVKVRSRSRAGSSASAEDGDGDWA